MCKYVLPIKDIDFVLTYLKRTHYREYMIAIVILNTALRISDVLTLTPAHFITAVSTKKNHLQITEQKRGKKRVIKIHDNFFKILSEYIDEQKIAYHDYIFTSQKSKKYNRPISDTQVHRTFYKIGRELNIEGLTTQSFRKTWAYRTYQETKDIAAIQKAMGHSNPSYTMYYIGIDQDQIDDIFDAVQFL